MKNKQAYMDYLKSVLKQEAYEGYAADIEAAVMLDLKHSIDQTLWEDTMDETETGTCKHEYKIELCKWDTISGNPEEYSLMVTSHYEKGMGGYKFQDIEF